MLLHRRCSRTAPAGPLLSAVCSLWGNLQHPLLQCSTWPVASQTMTLATVELRVFRREGRYMLCTCSMCPVASPVNDMYTTTLLTVAMQPYI
jgi:hypothetical protein